MEIIMKNRLLANSIYHNIFTINLGTVTLSSYFLQITEALQLYTLLFIEEQSMKMILLNSSLANGDKSPSHKICQMHTQSSQLACPT